MREVPVEGSEVECYIQDGDTLEYRQVKAIFSSSREKLPDGEEVWIYDAGTGAGEEVLLCQEPWSIKVLEIIEEVPEVKAVPQKIALGRLRGTMLETLIRQREDEERKKQE